MLPGRLGACAELSGREEEGIWDVLIGRELEVAELPCGDACGWGGCR